MSQTETIAPTCEMFNKMVEYGIALGVKNIKDYPGAWVQKVDDQWIFAVNGKDETLEVTPEGTMGASLGFGYAAVWFNGWLAGLLTPFGGEFVLGAVASEDLFIEALDRALAKAQSLEVNR